MNAHLSRWGAFQFRDEWDDLVQEVVLAAATALREGKLRDRKAAFAYLKSTTRFKFVDRLKRKTRTREDETLPWEDVITGDLEPESEGDPDLARTLRDALAALPEKQRDAVVAVHLQGHTYDEAAQATGIPLGSLKRHLRDGLAALREALPLETLT